MLYDKLVLQPCEQGIARYASMKRRIEKKMDRILETPYGQSKPLRQGKWEDLRGLRSVHFLGGKYVFLIAICEECIANGFQATNKHHCRKECKGLPLQQVVFVAFGTHDSTYGKP